jgi:hypothetical protein
MAIMLEDFNSKVGKEGIIFKPTISNESLHGNGNDNGVRIVNCAMTKSIMSTAFLHYNIYKKKHFDF